jgi:septal ring factor EnvC (AmiA/AmiB activator)
MLLFLACFFSVWVLPADISLTQAEARAIRQELLQMSAATSALKDELAAQREKSRALLEMSGKLQERLELASMRLEESEARLGTSQAELDALLTELASLRAEYGALWESWTLRKNEARKWMRLAAAGWISAALVVAGSVIWEVLN